MRAHLVASGALWLWLIACASSDVSNRELLVDERLPRPDHILVYDFASSPDEVPDESALAEHADAQRGGAAVPAEARELGARVAEELAARIREMGLAAERATAATRPRTNDIVIRGYFVSIDEGSAAERLIIGFDAGDSALRTVVEGFQETPQGLRKLGSGTVAAGGARGPGAALPAAVALATANPVGLIVSSAVEAGGELSGRNTIEGRAKATAVEIAKQIEPRFREQGWIP